ncbi:MAG: hypothetical protein KDD45_02805 [Bdellovibrionales bacterium]|nr:hypothetical protein [Bdellovibrionales bacterium]
MTPKHLLLKKLSSLDEAIINNSNSIAFNSKSKFKNVQTIFEKYPKQGNLFIEQINFLANILMSGWEWTSEERRPGRALEIVLEICEKGLIDSKEAFSSFPRAFRIGWKISQKN